MATISIVTGEPMASEGRRPKREPQLSFNKVFIEKSSNVKLVAPSPKKGKLRV